ncbi:Crp/Fnr family transcriptional regulator [Qipengyuania sp. JC766]|uniref:Crp/Fnr family transcriptional regulator n=1 Tax=Qipengyuania sp. JC766 TaxID=3232139 RepID=UPI00345A8F03
MSDPIVTDTRNILLQSLNPTARDALLHLATRHQLNRHQVLASPGECLDAVWFPETAIGSIIAETTDGQRIEAGLVGRDGFLPVQFALSDTQIAHLTVVQIPGIALSIAADPLRGLMKKCPDLREALLSFAHVHSFQTAQTALCNAAYRVEQRLARWLLMCHDRVDWNELPLVHEFISVMLGVRRASVTDALHVLEERQLVISERGCIVIRDRAALEDFAGPSYGEPEKLYRKLFGQALA